MELHSDSERSSAVIRERKQTSPFRPEKLALVLWQQKQSSKKESAPEFAVELVFAYNSIPVVSSHLLAMYLYSRSWHNKSQITSRLLNNTEILVKERLKSSQLKTQTTQIKPPCADPLSVFVNTWTLTITNRNQTTKHPWKNNTLYDAYKK